MFITPKEKKLTKELNKKHNRDSHIYIRFGGDYVELDGYFGAEELEEILEDLKWLAEEINAP